MDEAEIRHLEKLTHLLHRTNNQTLSRYASSTLTERSRQLGISPSALHDVCPRCSLVRQYGENTLIKRAGLLCTACRYLEKRPPVKKPSRASCLARQREQALRRLKQESQAGATAIKAPLDSKGPVKAGDRLASTTEGPAGKGKEKNKSKERKKARQQGLLKAMTQNAKTKKPTGSGLNLSDFML